MKQRAREQPFHPPPQKRRGLWKWTGFGKKTLWDWLQLLFVPLALALVGFLFTMSIERNNQQVEEQRAKSQQEIEKQRSQDTTLQSYIDQMTQLLINEGLSGSDPGDEVRASARARTLTALRGLDDAQRKASVVYYLYKSDLITKGQSSIGSSPREFRTQQGSTGIVSLSGADVSGADLSKAELSEADFTEANLSGANLTATRLFDARLVAADLRDADLRAAGLRGADLRRANLSNTDLSGGSELSNADLSMANLTDATVTQEQLDAAYSLEGATMPDGSKHD